MIKDFFHKSGKPLNELIPKTTRELGKCFSRLELASSKLGKREKELFDLCGFYLKKGSKERATVYANEIAEIRKVLSILQNIQISVERAILRLDTLKVASPTFESLKEVFGDARNALGLAANVMPSIMPEIDKLNSSIGEILQDTQFGVSMPAPLGVNDPTTEAILQKAATFVEQELQSRIPEPPTERKIPETVKPIRPLIALAADGSEVFLSKDGSTTTRNGSSNNFDTCTNPVSEELVIDYIERNNGEMKVIRCAIELNVSPAKVLGALESLSKKGKIRIEQ